MRVNRLFSGALLSGVLTLSLTAAPKNVLFICVDDLKPLLGCYGDTTIKTPNIDRLAARGVLFERAFCNQAVCAPSRNSLMTGLRPSSIGIYDLGTNFRKSVPESVTVAQYFMKQGYQTHALGKIMHVGHGNDEDAASWSTPHWRPKAAQYQLKESTDNGRPNKQGGPRGASTECADVPDTTYADGQIADEAIARLKAFKQNPGKPWFLGVGFAKPHLPFVAPKKYWDLYQRDAFPLPTVKTPPLGAPKFAPTTWGELRQYSDIPEVGTLDDAKTRLLIHGYHAATSYMDAQLGRLLDALDATGLANDTIILFWGDHGWHLGDHGMWCKHSNYEQAARIPLIVCAPGVAKAGVKTGSLAETVDIYPSLCELANLPPPKGLDGTSFVATLKDPATKTKEATFHVYPRGKVLGRAVRSERYRLVEWKAIGAPVTTAVYELYDYEKDPLETKNLIQELPEVATHLKSLLARQPEAKPQIQVPGDTPKKKAKKNT
jgi:iduronate 2-sulfatase